LEQGVSFGLFGVEHRPSIELMQVPARWHSSIGVQTFWVLTQTPFWQVSTVQASLSLLQEVPV
jgi:hypothetical protein